VFVPVLNDRALWKKWAGRDLAAAKNLKLDWAPLPPSQQTTTLLQPSAAGRLPWSYTFTQPVGNWFATDYSAAGWQTGPGGFGQQRETGPVIGTPWETSDIWARREFTLTAADLANRDQLQVMLYHDDDAEVYINGVAAFAAEGANNTYELFPVSRAALATLKPGKNILAVHVRDTGGDKYLDAGLATVK